MGTTCMITAEERIRDLEQEVVRLKEQVVKLPELAKTVEKIDREIFAVKATAAFTRWLTVIVAGVAGFFVDKVWKRT